MELSGTIEVSGITRLVIDCKDVWLKQTSKTGQFYWRKEHKEKRRSNDSIIQSIRGYVASPNHRVWIHNETVNVERLSEPMSKPNVPLLTQGPGVYNISFTVPQLR